MGIAATAFGSMTSALGDYSHAEGYSDSVAPDSMNLESTLEEILAAKEENNFSLAFGEASHTEGYNTIAFDYNSHAEGENTIAFGYNSHAEGYGTTASGDNSHVQGQYNIEDPNSYYAHVVGNGTDENARSNAHTLDWDGNAWFAGDVYVGSTSGTNKDKGSKKLATEEYVMNEITKNYIQIITWEDND
jgi:hypothetical protein